MKPTAEEYRKRLAQRRLNHFLKCISAVFSVMMIVLIMTSCSAVNDAFSGREASDLRAYSSMGDYAGEIMLVDTTVREVADMMDDDQTFAFITAYADCPWCNRLIPYVNEAAKEAGIHVGYIDTRKNPEWQSNLDIDDYDLFVEYFHDWLDEDEEGRLHLYTPDMYFIKNGKVVEIHSGVTAGIEDPDTELTSEQEDQLMQELADKFAKMR